jgi:hypothetical protein
MTEYEQVARKQGLIEESALRGFNGLDILDDRPDRDSSLSGHSRHADAVETLMQRLRLS